MTAPTTASTPPAAAPNRVITYVSVCDAALANIKSVGEGWFKVPYRSKAETLRMMFGDNWDITYLPLRSTYNRGAATPGTSTVPGFLLTDPTPGQPVALCLFASDPARWYNPLRSPTGEPEHPLEPREEATFRARLAYPRDLYVPCARRVAHARTVVSTITLGADLGKLIAYFGDAAAAGNLGVRGYVPALFEHWLATRSLPVADAEAMRTLVALGGYRVAVDLTRTQST